MKLHQSIISAASFSILLAAPMANAATWCGGTEVQDVICYSDKSCFVTANGYGGVRYYKIDGDDPSKNSMVSLATAAMLAKSRVRLVFAASDLNCADVPQNSKLYGVGVTELF